jgi:hypothetical protein
VIWNVQPDRILIGKQGQKPTSHALADLVLVTPLTNSSKTAIFTFATKQNQDPVEERCATLEQMKGLINAIGTNAFILKLPPPDPMAQSAAAPRLAAEPSGDAGALPPE